MVKIKSPLDIFAISSYLWHRTPSHQFSHGLPPHYSAKDANSPIRSNLTVTSTCTRSSFFVKFGYVNMNLYPYNQKIHPKLRGNFWVMGYERKFHPKSSFMGEIRAHPKFNFILGYGYMYCKDGGHMYMHPKCNL